MLNVITNPTGIDIPIRKLQTALHSSLMTQWGLDVNDTDENALYQSYGRCYRNKKGNGYVAELFTSGKDYKEAYWDDNLAALSFFGISDSIEQGNSVDIHLVFFVDLLRLKPSITHRADEEVRQDVMQSFGKFSHGFTFNSVDLWIENVLREYPGSYRDERLKAVDMHPVHCFRLNLSLFYNNKICL